MKKKKVIKKVFAVIMALSVIFSYSVVAMADGEEPISNPCLKCNSDHSHVDDCYSHSWDEGEETTIPTCTTPGEKTFKCTVEGCVATKTEPIPALGHEYGTDGMCIHEGCKESITIGSDIVALIGNTPYTTLDDAIAAASDGDTVIVLQKCTTSGLNLSKNLTIKGARGAAAPEIEFTQYGIALWGISLTFKDCDVVMNGIGSTPYTSEWNWMSICASKDASLTLDNVSMTMNGQDANKHAIYFCSNNKLNIVNGSSLTITGYKQDALEWDGGDGGYNVNIIDSKFISDHNRSGFTGTFYATITRSVVDVINSLGNGSNGSHFNITEDSVVRFNNNGSHGLSAGNLTIDDSTVEACDNGANGIHTIGTMVMSNGSDIKIQRNRCSISSQWTIPGALYVGRNGTIDETCTVDITDNRGSGIYVNTTGSLDMATGTVMRNTAEKLGFGGGIYNNGNTELGNKVILYNNHAKKAGDDIYNVEGAVIKFHAVGSDWVLDDCGHKITGWYYDNVPYIAEMSDSEPQLLSVGDGYNGGRWSVKGCEILDPVSGTASKAEVTNAYEYAETAAEGVIALKAAHGVPALPPYIPVTPESVYTVTYMDGVDDEVVFEDQSTTNLKKGDKTPAFTGEPVREGYKFIGWSPEVAETVSGDAVYYAQWEKLPEEPSVVDPSGDNDPIDDGKDIDAQPNGDADTEAKGVKTGDETMLAMWGALGLLAALGLGGALVIGRRREE